jgi:EcsC family protein
MSKSDASLVGRLFQSAIRRGFRRSYPQLEVNPEKYLRDVRRLHNLPIRSWKDVHMLDEQLLSKIAGTVISSSSRMAALEGLGLGAGGFATVLPDMGILAAITLRMLQKLSLIYGFEYSTTDEVAALWIAAASAAGVNFTREYLEKQAVEKIAPRVIDAIAVKVGTEVAEKWVGRFVPLLSAGAAATLNFYFVRSWGRRAQKHFVEKHRSVRGEASAERALWATATEG